MSFWHNPLIDRQFRLNQSTNSHWNLYDSHRQSVQDLITSNKVFDLFGFFLCVMLVYAFLKLDDESVNKTLS